MTRLQDEAVLGQDRAAGEFDGEVGEGVAVDVALQHGAAAAAGAELDQLAGDAREGRAAQGEGLVAVGGGVGVDAPEDDAVAGGGVEIDDAVGLEGSSLRNRKRSLPSPPISSSRPPPPSSRSRPAPPSSVSPSLPPVSSSLPRPPSSRNFPRAPFRASSPSPPERVKSRGAPKKRRLYVNESESFPASPERVSSSPVPASVNVSSPADPTIVSRLTKLECGSLITTMPGAAKVILLSPRPDKLMMIREDICSAVRSASRTPDPLARLMASNSTNAQESGQQPPPWSGEVSLRQTRRSESPDTWEI